MDRVGHLCRPCRRNGRDSEMGWRASSSSTWKGLWRGDVCGWGGGLGDAGYLFVMGVVRGFE